MIAESPPTRLVLSLIFCTKGYNPNAEGYSYVTPDPADLKQASVSKPIILNVRCPLHLNHALNAILFGSFNIHLYGEITLIRNHRLQF